ncbi:MAG TPA: serine/threonine-protein kinase [Kofleriaceae bacterium]|nr:serine/threonine-protein kinase [Kofleriaceae bacterium]
MNLVGQRIGSYIVERELGAGGTGTVYLCKHTLIERDVAVKVLHDDQARDPDQVARFFQEAKAAAEIGHPNIIVIIDFGTLHLPEGDRSYLMMECLDGMSLDKRLRQGGLALEDIRHTLTQVCSALTASHAKGIIHRDLKPPNVFLCDRSFDPLFVKVLDFGIAKLTTPAPGVRKTQYGIVIGTPAYMSPEQCEGKGAIDHRSDIYSLGCMLYEMLTGTLPYPGEIGEMLRGHIYQQVEPPSVRNPSVPPEWEALCLHLMQKEKSARPQSMVDVAHALDDLRGHEAAYRAAVATRAASGHSGHTAILRSDDGDGAGAGRHSEAAVAAQPTLHVELHAVVAAAPVPPVEPVADISSGPFVAIPPSQWPAASDQLPAVEPAPQDPAAVACAALVSDPRSAAFLATLLTRPPGRWSAVRELCATSGCAIPLHVPPPPLFVTWLDHPYLDPSVCAVVFLSLRDGWSTSLLTARLRW